MVFKLEMNGAPVSSGMGTCGLVGPIGVISGWLNPDAAAAGASAIVPGRMDWIGLILICFVLPAVFSLIFDFILRKIGWVKEGDMKLSV